AVQDDRVGGGAGEQVLVHGVRLVQRGVLAVLAHRHPRGGGEDVGASRGRRGVVGGGHGPAGRGGDLGGAGHHGGVGPQRRGRGEPDGRPGGGAAEQVRVRHVVGAVAEVGAHHAGESALRLPHGLQVGEDLAGVELVGEGVDDGHGGAGGHLQIGRAHV